MATKKAAEKESKVKNLLTAGYFGKDKNEPLKPSDPIAPTPMLLTVDQIDLYDKNPRLRENPSYRDLKESIRAAGEFTGTLDITRRPGNERYMIEAGGNTRLMILKELHEELGG